MGKGIVLEDVVSVSWKLVQISWWANTFAMEVDHRILNQLWIG